MFKRFDFRQHFSGTQVTPRNTVKLAVNPLDIKFTVINRNGIFLTVFTKPQIDPHLESVKYFAHLHFLLSSILTFIFQAVLQNFRLKQSTHFLCYHCIIHVVLISP